VYNLAQVQWYRLHLLDSLQPHRPSEAETSGVQKIFMPTGESFLPLPYTGDILD